MRGIEAGVNAPAFVLILNSIHTVERIKMVNYDAIRVYQSSPKSSLNGSPMILKMIPMIPIIAQNGIKTNDGDGDCDGDGEENKFRTTI